MAFTNWFSGLSNQRRLNSDTMDSTDYTYSGKYMNPSTGTSTSSSSTTSYGFSGTWDTWTKEEKKTLAKVGFKYDKKKKEWCLDLTATIKIPQLDGLASIYSSGPNGKPTDEMIKLLKQAKKHLIEKLTAKIILAELVRPREIKDK